MIRAEIDQINDQLRATTEVLERGHCRHYPTSGGRLSGGPLPPLISSTWEWVEQTKALKARKQYGTNGSGRVTALKGEGGGREGGDRGGGPPPTPRPSGGYGASQCPRGCAYGSNLHISNGKVEVFYRTEDDERVLVTAVDGRAVQVDLVPNDGSEGKSRAYDVMAFAFISGASSAATGWSLTSPNTKARP